MALLRIAFRALYMKVVEEVDQEIDNVKGWTGFNQDC